MLRKTENSDDQCIDQGYKKAIVLELHYIINQ